MSDAAADAREARNQLGWLWKAAVGVLTALMVGGIGAMIGVWSDVAVIREQIATDKARIQAVEERISFTLREEPGREGRLAKIESRLDMMGDTLRRIERAVDRTERQWGEQDQRSDVGPVIPELRALQ